MASYAGLGIFGAGVTMTTSDYPRECQVNTFFGVNGLETLDGGFRGRVTRVRGTLSGQSAPLLASAEGVFRTYNDGLARVLVDNLGTAWPNVKLLKFQPIGRIRQSADGVFFRPYWAIFLHLA
jgi:hypothetical protein